MEDWSCDPSRRDACQQSVPSTHCFLTHHLLTHPCLAHVLDGVDLYRYDDMGRRTDREMWWPKRCGVFLSFFTLFAHSLRYCTVGRFFRPVVF